ncbi:hypothetical protein EMCRGX_G018964 [Ephydatia muelleri]
MGMLWSGLVTTTTSSSLAQPRRNKSKGLTLLVQGWGYRNLHCTGYTPRHNEPVPLTISAVPGQVAITGSNITLLCNVQLDPSVDSTVMGTSTWTAPGGATLSGSNPLWIGSSNQSTLMLTSLGTGNAGSYVCGVSALIDVRVTYTDGGAPLASFMD